MSDLLIAGAGTEVQNQGPDETFYKYTNGAYSGVFIRITQTRLDEDIDGDEVPDQANYKTLGSMVDVDNTILTSSKGTPFTVCDMTSVKIDAIITGALTEDEVKADAKDRVVHKLARQRAFLDMG